MSDWYKRNPAKFIGGVVGLGPDVIGAYSIILDLIYQHDGPVSNDARYLGGILGCSSRKAASLVERLVEAGKLIVNSDGKISNEKAEEVIEERAKQHRERAESGAKGGRSTHEATTKQSRNKRENEVDDKENNELEKAEVEHLDKKREDKKERADELAKAHFPEWYAAYPKHIGRGQAERAYRQALKKAEPPVLLSAARKFAVACTGRDPQFIAHPATWLNGERWLDDAEPTASQPAASTHLRNIIERYGAAS